MKTIEKTPVKLKNRYTGEVVYTKDMNDLTFSDGITFLKVYNDKQPSRIYLANREAFDKMI